MADKTKRTYPEIWSDDEQMNVMFSHFRQSREINPRSWDSKIKFWTDLIRCECWRCGDVVVDIAAFPDRFDREGRTPKCLGRIFNEMKVNKDLLPLDEFVKEANLTMATWAFDRLVVGPVRWSWQSVMGGESVEEITNGRYVMVSVLKSIADSVLAAHNAHVKNPVIDHVTDFTQVRRQCEKVCKDDESLYLALLWLKKQNLVHLIQVGGMGADKVRAVKFASKDSEMVNPIDEFDKKVIKLKQTESDLEMEIDKNYVEMEGALAEAKKHVKEGQKASARAALRQKNKCADQIDKRTTALSNVQNILSKIRDSHADRQIVEAYEAGAEALKASNRAAPDTSQVDNIMTELEELFEQQQEVDASMSVGPTCMNDDDVSLSELEGELELIMAGEDKHRTDIGSSSRLPSVPTYDPRVPAPDKRRLPVPDVEPADCDLSDDDDDLLAHLPDPSFPSVPQFTPSSPDGAGDPNRKTAAAAAGVK